MNERGQKAEIIKFNYIFANLIQYISATRKSFNNVTVNYSEEPVPVLRQRLIERKKSVNGCKIQQRVIGFVLN